MIKSKKISKQSLVIAVLSILLLLSMALYATGAYFTDQYESEVPEATLEFGTVRVDASYAEVEDERVISYEDYIVPGDELHYAGSIDPSAATVEMLVYIEFTFTVEIGGTEYTKLYLNNTDNTEAFTVTVGELPLTSGWTAADDKYTASMPQGTAGAVYTVAAGAVGGDFETSVVFVPEAGNVVYAGETAGSRTAITLNDTETVDDPDTVSMTVTTKLTVKAIQSKVAEADIATTVTDAFFWPAP